MEVGIGPICRKLDNALLARKIPANLPEAQMAAARVDVNMLPEPVRATFGQVMADLTDFATTDWRKTVKRIEWVLSWDLMTAARKMLIMVVRFLGYVGLAALLAGEASTGAATVMFQGGRLYLSGSRNKSGAYAFKKMYGWRFHQATATTKAAWSVPAAAADAFAMVVMTHWPNVSGLEEAVTAAKSAPVEAPTTASAPAAPEVSISAAVDGWHKVKTPYNVGFVIEIKKLPYKSRKWSVVDKVWEVSADVLDDVKALIEKHYKVAVAVAAAA